MSSPTIKLVAAEAGVSVATVSYVLSGRAGGEARIGEQTKARVLEAATRLGYQPNQQARGVRRGRTEQVCLVLRQLDSPWAKAMADEVSRTMREIGYSSLILLDGDWSKFLLGRGADGALIDHLNPATDGPMLKALAQQGVALVVHSNELEPDGFDVIRSEEQTALAEAMDLLTANHTRIACLQRTRDDSRYAAYRAGLERAGLPYDERLIRTTRNSKDLAYRAAVDLLDRDDRPTAIFACSDLTATSAIWAAHRLGLAIPEELQIVGVGNTPDAAQSDPPLTSVGPDAVFPAAAQLLLTRLKNGGPGRLHEAPWRLHRRTTC